MDRNADEPEYVISYDELLERVLATSVAIVLRPRRVLSGR